MARKRMFSLQVVDSDAFLDLPLSTQALYFHLGMRADDDGFLNNAKKICRTIGANEDDLKLLVAKNFLIPFESGVIVIKHWRMNNYLQRDRTNPTVYQEEFNQLTLKKNKAYTKCIQNVYTDKIRLDKNRLDYSHSLGRFGNVTLSDFEKDSLELETDKEIANEYIEKLSVHKESTGATYESDYATIIKWLTDDGLIK